VVLADTKVWWYVSRASGTVAWVLVAASVLWGLALSTRALGPAPRAPWLLDVHRFLGALAVVFVGVHLVALVFDPVVAFGIDALLVPMASEWEPGAVAWGVVALYLLVAVEVTSLLKKHIRPRVWRGVHLTAYLLYVLSTVHLLLAGTDRTNPLLRGAVVVSVAAVAFFTVYRWVGPGRVRSARAGRERTRQAATPPPLNGHPARADEMNVRGGAAGEVLGRDARRQTIPDAASRGG
jgi:DMSO/TMAO reductase YedYZ heme-binding membrane subunit